jgi:hypothetical protein
MDIHRNAAIVARDEITIEAPVATVWEIFTDIPRWPDWNANITGAGIDGPLAVGATFHWLTAVTVNSSVVMELAPMERIIWSGDVNGFTVVHLWQFSPVNDHRSSVRAEESWSGVVDIRQKEFFRRSRGESIRYWLESLKRKAEATADLPRR